MSGDQLSLIDPKPVAWRLDEPTREAGRRGIEAARLALLEASRRRQERESLHRAA
jgi:hypothetical protein